MKTAIIKSRYFLLCLLSVTVLSAALQPSSAHAQGENTACTEYFLTFPAWYRGLLENCEVKAPSEGTGGITGYVWIIGLNLVEIILNLVGYAAVAYIIYGGYKYMTSAGSPDGMVSARKTIMNASIGLIISIAAVAIVRTIAAGAGIQGNANVKDYENEDTSVIIREAHS